MRNKVVYIGNFSISKMDAESQLVLGNSMVLKNLGYDVTLIGNDSTLGSCTTPLQTLRHLPESFPCYNILFKKSLKELFNRAQLSSVIQILQVIGTESILYIVCYGSPGYAKLLFRLSDFAHKHGIKIIYNCVDIPELNHGSLIQKIAKKVDRFFLHQAIIRKMDGVIAVSTYIQQFFSRKTRCPFVVIPPLKDTSSFVLDWKPKSTNVRNIVYVGVPFPIDGRQVSETAYKDRIDLFIDLLTQMPDIKFQFDIYGLNKDQYTNVVKRQRAILEQFNDRIFFHGRIDHDTALKVVSQADFTLIYRRRNKMTMAGFSTKFVESICCGTPAIITDTSEYIRYQEKGAKIVVLNPDDWKQQSETLSAALSLDDQTLMELKQACLNCKVFDYRNFVSPMKDFLSKVDSTEK